MEIKIEPKAEYIEICGMKYSFRLFEAWGRDGIEICLNCPYEKCVYEVTTRSMRKREIRRAQVKVLCMEGKSQRKIAKLLGVSEWTVENDIKAIKEELMTKQEEIREWLAREFFKHEAGYNDENFPEEYWTSMCEADQSNAIVCGELADKALSYLHSQGVVIINAKTGYVEPLIKGKE